MGTLGRKLPKRTRYSAARFVGRRFGNRIVLAIGPVVRGYQMWSVRCDCGAVSLVSAVAIVEKREGRRCRKCQANDQVAHRGRSWRGGKHVPMTEFNRWRRSAETRRLDWSVTIPYLDKIIVTQNWRCSLSGEPLSFNRGYNNSRGGNASLDRIDSARGYVRGNVRFVTKAVNFARQSLSDEAFIALCLQVVAARCPI